MPSYLEGLALLEKKTTARWRDQTVNRMRHKVNYTYLYSTLIVSKARHTYHCTPQCLTMGSTGSSETSRSLKPRGFGCQFLSMDTIHSWATPHSSALHIRHPSRMERVIDQLLPSRSQKFYLIVHACRANQPTPSSSKLRCSLSATTLSPLSETTSALISPTSSGSFPSPLLQSC